MVAVRQKLRKRTIGRLDRAVVQDSMTPARLAHDTLVSASRYDSLLTVVLSENKVKQQTQTWRQQQDNYPGNDIVPIMYSICMNDSMSLSPLFS